MFRGKGQEILGIAVILVSVLIVLALASYSHQDYRVLAGGGVISNIIGPVGAWIAYVFRTAFGLTAYITAAAICICGYSMVRSGSPRPVLEKVFSLIFFSITLSIFISAVYDTAVQLSGGIVGSYLNAMLLSLLGSAGSLIVEVVLNLIALSLLGLVSFSRVVADFLDRRHSADKIRFFGGLFASKKYSDTIPLNSIQEDLKKSGKKRMPWIIKKTIPVNHPATQPDNSAKYLQLSVTDAAGSILSSSGSVHEMIRESLKEPSVQEIIGNSGLQTSSFDGNETPEWSFIDEDDTIVSPDDISQDEGLEIITINSSDISEEDISEDIEEYDYTDEQASLTPDFTEAVELHSASKEQGNSENQPSKLNDTISRNRIISIGLEEQVASESPSHSDEFLDNDDHIGKGNTPESITDSSAEAVEQLFDEIPINNDYIIPTGFLTSSTPADTESWQNEIKKYSALLVNTLADFSIESKVVNVNRGPVITLYELQIAPGIKVNRIVSLSDDIAMALAASRVRIVAPIPGKSAIGVEVPNKIREMVTVGDIITSDEYLTKPGCLKVALGKDILGKPLTLDLKRLPHLLIAGATGSGKSVCVNAIISSLVYNYDPNYVRFIMVDPKMVELQIYDGMPHLLTPVITEPHAAPMALKWAIYEMDRRYRLLSAVNTRDIERYNEKASQSGSLENLPYIVVIIDELADLMMVASKEVEGYITRLAQKARAIGIHLVLATQRPSVDVLTGIIKANVPARIAFQVAQKTDSRTIIDQNGAEKLLGKGDMLYQSPMSSFPVRVQGAFISEDESISVVEHLKKYARPDYIDIEECLFAAEQQRQEDEGDDELFVEALKIVEETRKASASYLQRRLSIGYNRAARIIEQMEDRGYVGPQQGSKPREIFI